MRIEEEYFPEGFNLPMDYGTEEEREGRKLYLSLGITEERYQQLKDKLARIVLNAMSEAKTKILQLDKMIAKVGKISKNIAELTLSMYVVGVVLEREQQRQRGTPPLGLPGVSARVIIIGGSGAPQQSDEEEDIDALIRRSKEINGDYNNPKKKDEEED